MNKLVSIILPTFNGGSFIKQSIDSCLNQTYSNIELIIINDCSTDSTERIIKEYSDKRIRYYKNICNEKLPKSLNIGFKYAVGTYFTWTSDDNYFDATAIEKMVLAIESKQAALVCAPYYTIDNDSNVTGTRDVGSQKNILVDNVVKACFLYKRGVHEKLVGYDSELFLVEDYDFWIRATYEGFTFFQLDEKLYYYRFHESSLTAKRSNDISKALYHLLLNHELKFKNKRMFKELNAQFYLKLSKLAIANNDQVFRFFSLALIKNPLLIFSRTAVKILLTRLN